MPVNEYGQMIGEPVDDLGLPSLVPDRRTVYDYRSSVSRKHAEDLLSIYGPESPREMWTISFNRQ